MSAPGTNPFPDDPDRSAIWDVLMRRDFEAFVAADWSRVGPDFLEDEFAAIDAKGEISPAKWSLQFAQIESYRSEWLRQAAAFLPVELQGTTKLEFLYQSTTLDRIQITSGRALAHKRFDGRAVSTAGIEIRLDWQTLYFLRKWESGWKITGFIGYLPNQR